MLTLLKKVGNVLKRLFGTLLPMFSRARKPGVGPGARWGLHAVLVIFVLIALGVIHQFLGLQAYLPGAPAFLKQLWLPLLFLLVYILCWLVWWFYTLLRAAPEASPFPDIDRAWEEAKRALTDKGLDLTEVPLFLLLGRPDAGVGVLFESISLLVSQAPNRSEAPLHVYANREAIYVTCVGASLLGLQSQVLAGEVLLGGDEDPGSVEVDSSTLRPDQDPVANRVMDISRQIREVEDRARAEGRNLNSLTKAEALTIKRLKRSLTRLARPQELHKHPEEVARQTARLQHLCGLIARDRRPFCGVNGIMVLIPMAATDDDLDAHETGTCCLEDLETARAAFQVHCPTFALVCGLEQVPGYDAFIANFPDPQRGRVGQRFPLVPEVRPDQIPAMFESGVKWLGLRMFPGLALPHWRVENPGITTLEEAIRHNAELFRFLSEIRERQARISTILARGMSRVMLGGCYIAGTGIGSDREKAFLRPVFARLTGEQNNVSWTPEAVAEEDSYHRMVWYGYRILAATAVLGMTALAFLTLGVLRT